MSDTQGFGPPLRVGVAGEEDVDGARLESLGVGDAKVGGEALGLVAVECGGLVLLVEDEPEFEAGIGERDVDPASAGLGDGLFEVRVLVDVEDAPDLVEVSTLLASASPVRSLMFASALDEAEWRHAGLGEVDVDVVAPAGPLHEVGGFGDCAFGEHTDDAEGVASSWHPTGCAAVGSFHASTSARLALISPRSTTGTAPNLPWR